MSKTYIIGINNVALPVIKKIKDKYSNDNIVTALIYDFNNLADEDNIPDIKIKSGFDFDVAPCGYENISLSYLSYAKEEIDNLIEEINEEDNVILYNSLINTGSLETYAYLCEKLSDKVNSCIALYCLAFRFGGTHRREYANDISERIKKTKCKIIQVKESELKEKYDISSTVDIIDISYQEYFKIIDNILDSIGGNNEKK